MTPAETKERAELVAQRAVVLDLVENSFAPGTHHRQLFDNTREEICRMVNDCESEDDKGVVLLAMGIAGIDAQLSNQEKKNGA
jgi:hypothetical protein